jgi:hypothetical protein
LSFPCFAKDNAYLVVRTVVRIDLRSEAIESLSRLIYGARRATTPQSPAATGNRQIGSMALAIGAATCGVSSIPLQ